MEWQGKCAQFHIAQSQKCSTHLEKVAEIRGTVLFWNAQTNNALDMSSERFAPPKIRNWIKFSAHYALQVCEWYCDVHNLACFRIYWFRVCFRVMEPHCSSPSLDCPHNFPHSTVGKWTLSLSGFRSYWMEQQNRKIDKLRRKKRQQHSLYTQPECIITKFFDTLYPT